MFVQYSGVRLPPQISVLYMTLNNLIGSIPGALKNVEYSFIAITPRSTLTS